MEFEWGGWVMWFCFCIEYRAMPRKVKFGVDHDDDDEYDMYDDDYDDCGDDYDYEDDTPRVEEKGECLFLGTFVFVLLQYLDFIHVSTLKGKLIIYNPVACI